MDWIWGMLGGDTGGLYEVLVKRCACVDGDCVDYAS
jgi:hypothetical protein